MLMSVSNVFPRITETQPLSISGSGIILYPPEDPKGLLGLTFFVVESDAGKRNLGKVLERLFGQDKVKGAVDGLIKKVTDATLAGLIGAVVDVLPGVFKANKDDVLFAHNHSGYDFDRYGLGFDSTARMVDYPVGNHRAKGTLRVAVIE
jgi:hypothetical protein